MVPYETLLASSLRCIPLSGDEFSSIVLSVTVFGCYVSLVYAPCYNIHSNQLVLFGVPVFSISFVSSLPHFRSTVIIQMLVKHTLMWYNMSPLLEQIYPPRSCKITDRNLSPTSTLPHSSTFHHNLPFQESPRQSPTPDSRH